MSQVIIYGSKYGTAEKYAEELSKKLEINCFNYKGIENINDCSRIIYIGALYAGGVLGLSKTFKKVHSVEDKEILIATVGLADVNDEKNIINIRKSVKEQLPAEIYKKAKIYHLRGGIDYLALGLKHKVMMSLLYKKIKNLPEEKKTAEIKAMIDTYNKKVDFVNFDELDDIVEYISKSTFKDSIY